MSTLLQSVRKAERSTSSRWCSAAAGVTARIATAALENWINLAPRSEKLVGRNAFDSLTNDDRFVLSTRRLPSEEHYIFIDFNSPGTLFDTGCPELIALQIHERYPEAAPAGELRLANRLLDYELEACGDPDTEPLTGWIHATRMLWSTRELLAPPSAPVSRPALEQDASEDDAFEQLLQRISEAFWPFEKVHAVYVQKFRGELQVIVTLCVEVFDRDLMDALLDVEYDLRQSAPEIFFNFTYPPVGAVSRDDFMSSAARPLFSKLNR